MVDISVHKLMDEWIDNGYKEGLKSGDAIHARYSRYIATVECASCRKYEVRCFITVILQEAEKSGGAKFYLNNVSVRKSGSRETAVSACAPETTPATATEKEPGVYVTSL